MKKQIQYWSIQRGTETVVHTIYQAEQFVESVLKSLHALGYNTVVHPIGWELTKEQFIKLNAPKGLDYNSQDEWMKDYEEFNREFQANLNVQEMEF